VSVKLLFDENLSPRLVAKLADVYPLSAHVATADLTTAPDELIWEYAAANGFVIVTKDDDFRQRSFLRGFPPKVIWLQFGNCPTELIAAALRDRLADRQTFVADSAKALLILSRIH
jgi:predicted nuclease of predicted toxin-antitoxin system